MDELELYNDVYNLLASTSYTDTEKAKCVAAITLAVTDYMDNGEIAYESVDSEIDILKKKMGR